MSKRKGGRPRTNPTDPLVQVSGAFRRAMGSSGLSFRELSGRLKRNGVPLGHSVLMSIASGKQRTTRLSVLLAVAGVLAERADELVVHGVMLRADTAVLGYREGMGRATLCHAKSLAIEATQ